MSSMESLPPINAGNKPFVDIKTGLKQDLDSREGSILAQAPNSGIALDPDKHYVFESPDGTDIQHMKGSSPDAYKLLQSGYDIQNNTFFDEVDDLKDSLDPEDPNTNPALHFLSLIHI